MATGTCKWFNYDKGFGFIVPDQAGPDVFLHISDVNKANLDEVREGDKLEYEVGQGRNGRPCAQKIRSAK